MNEPKKDFDDVLSEALSAAQAILAFNGFDDETIYSVEIASAKQMMESPDKVATTTKAKCCKLWDCTVTNGGRCTCRRWGKC